MSKKRNTFVIDREISDSDENFEPRTLKSFTLAIDLREFSSLSYSWSRQNEEYTLVIKGSGNGCNLHETFSGDRETFAELEEQIKNMLLEWAAIRENGNG